MQINDKREELPLSFLASTLDLLCLKRKKNKRLPAQISRVCLGESAEIINGVFVHLAGTMAKCPLTEGLL